MKIDYYNDNWIILTELERGVKKYLEESFASLPENYVILPRYSSLGKSSCYIRSYLNCGDYVLMPRNQLEALLTTSRFPIELSAILHKYYETRFITLATYVLRNLGIEIKSEPSNLAKTILWLESKGYVEEEFDSHRLETNKVKRMYQSQVVATGPNRLDEQAKVTYEEFCKVLEESKEKVYNVLPGIRLRDFQVEAVMGFLTHKVGDLPMPGGIVKAPARSGKTEVLCALAKVIGQPTLVLTDRKQLIQQIRDRMLVRKLDEKIGYVDGSTNTVENVTVSTIQSINKNPSLASNVYFTIVDEVHTISNERFTANFDQIGLSRSIEENEGFLMRSLSPVRLGTSATPFGYNEAKNQCVVSGAGSVCYEIARHRLEKLGIVAESKVIIFELDHRLCTKKYKIQDTNAQELYLYHYAYNETRNKLVQIAMKLACKEGGRHLILVKNRKHIEALRKDLPDALYVFGSETESYEDEVTRKKKTRTIASMKVKERKQKIDEFLSKENCILIATSVVFTGIDFPGGMHSVINLAAGSSFETIIQRICRGLNPNEEKRVVHLYDVLDGGRGSAKLKTAAELREKAYQLEGFEVKRVKVPRRFYEN